MPKKNSYITITDQFCGAGGSSQGARNYGRSIGGGVEVKLALNHWKLDNTYTVLGCSKDQVKQLGNAVTPGQCIKSLN